MAKPDCDDGWIKKAVELEAAVAFGDFTMIAQTILRYAFLQMFGKGKRPRLVRLCCAEIAARIGRDASAVHRARRELVASGVLVQYGDDPDVFRFIKDYEKWVKTRRVKASFEPTAEPLLTRTEVKDCMDAPEYSRQFEKGERSGNAAVKLHRTPLSDQQKSPVNPHHEPGTSAPDDRVNLHPATGYIDTRQSGTSAPGDRVQIDPISSPPYVPPSRKRELENREREEQEELDSVSSERRANDVEPAAAPAPQTPNDRLVAWVQDLIRQAEYPDKTIQDAASLCRRWTSKAGDPEICAASFQAALDANTLDPVQYAQKILTRIWKARELGEVVESPAICSFRANPDAPPPPPTPATGKLSRGEKFDADLAAEREAMRAYRLSKEASCVQG